MAHGGLLSAIYLLMFLFMAFIMTADPNAPKWLLLFMGGFMIIFSLIFVVPQIIGGWKMFKEHPNAKNWGIVGSILSCMNFPLGTAAGVFALIFIFGDEGKQFYDNQVSKNYLPQQNSFNDFNYQNYQQKQREPHSWK
jgi:hypothetical protein